LGIPDGASRFQYPGLARSLTAYCVDDLVFLGDQIFKIAARGPLARALKSGIRTWTAALCKISIGQL